MTTSLLDRSPRPPAYVVGPAGQRTYWYMGALLKLLATSADTDGQFALIETVMRRGLEPPYHAHHHEDEAIFLLAGEMEFTVAGVSCHLRAGDYIYLPRQQPHRFRILSDTCHYLVQLFPAGLEEMFVALGEPAPQAELPARPPGPPLPELLACLSDLQQRYGIEVTPTASF
ncbi:hypothetical protein GCM10023185_09420 [Hymenobacter saemangeumensis]|uniref:Cupin type-2 domain-containing protein n=1 Tax=Hymenobacter saemangeumensis TaxID=1084522 RepID=A0ABP8I496_9BACT